MFWHLELLSLSVEDLSVRDASLVGLLKVLQLLGCCLPQFQGLQALLAISSISFFEAGQCQVQCSPNLHVCTSVPAQTAEFAPGGFW